MGISLQKMMFRLGTACFAIGIALCGRAISAAQQGPDWEVPVAVIEQMLLLERLALPLWILGVLAAVVARYYPGIPKAARVFYFELCAVALGALCILWTADPAQWQGRFPLLSRVSEYLTVPSALLGVLAFWGVSFRALRSKGAG